MNAAMVPANIGRKGLVEVDGTLPVETPEQIGTALAGLSAALVQAIDGADDISLEIDANADGVHYRFRSYRRSTSR